MDKNAFEERRRALEDAFFMKQDSKLVDKMRQQTGREALAAASGVSDPAALDALMASGITARTLAALSLVPLVFVAWADHIMDERERQAVLAAAADAGVPSDGPGYQLLAGWLVERPPAALFEAWQRSVAATMQQLDRTTGEQLAHSVVQRARSVAQATGGILGIASISAVEREILDQIEKAFA